MNFEFSQFEIKQLDAKNWRYISEVAALELLQDNYRRITPILRQMLHGKEITTPDCIIRIRILNSKKNIKLAKNQLLL